jgi:hypothetical protein
MRLETSRPCHREAVTTMAPSAPSDFLESSVGPLVEVPHLPQLFVRAQEWFALPHRKLHQV